MKQLPNVAVALLTAAAFASPLGAQEIPWIPVKGGIDWVQGYAKGKKLAQESGKPLFVVFRCER